jgi:acyl-CoA synthetase (AMP-forming)/AMP-acid ligase II
MHPEAAMPPPLPSLLHYLDRYAVEAPERLAAIDGDQRLSYATLHDAVNRCCEGLKSLGVTPGDRVAFMGVPGVSFWVSLLGTLRAQACWMGLNPQHTERELGHVLGDARPVLTLVSSDTPEAARHQLARGSAAAQVNAPLALDDGTTPLSPTLIEQARDAVVSRASSDAATSVELAREGVCLIVYTSGTTGQPKGALLTGAGLVENGWWMARRLGWEPHRVLVNLPVNHVGCIGDVCATALVLGGTMVFMPRFDAGAAVQVLKDHQITWLPQVPAQYQLMLTKGGLDAQALASVRSLAWGGAAMPGSLIQQLQSWVPDMFNSYGLTECSGTITISERGASLDALAQTIGKPVDPARVRIADAQDRSLPAGEGGEIQICGPHVFQGYLHNPAATRATFTADGWLRTGDLGQAGADGNIRLLGRTREMYKSGGYNVYPREVESVIEGLPGVELCAVVGLPDALWGEVGVAFVQGDPATVTVDSLAAHCATQLARYKCPKRFVVRAALPLLPVGKVDKQALKATESAT